MRNEDFTERAPGRLIPIPEGCFAFLPNPLPPTINFNQRMAMALANAHENIGRLAGAGQRLPNPSLLIRPFLQREAILSSRIEGTYATPQEMVLFQVAPVEQSDRSDIKEVINYANALYAGMRRLQEIPVSLRLIKELHENLLKNVRGKERRPGEFRSIQNFIGDSNQNIHAARFVPPPVVEMKHALHEFETYLHRDDGLPLLVKLALIHYQFEAIHPFLDGNGRVGRLLIPLILCERKSLPQPLLYLSAFFEEHREKYVDHLLAVSQKGAWEDWVQFFLTGVAEQASDAVRRTEALLGLWQEFRGAVQHARSSALLPKLVDQLFASPAITITVAQKMLRVSYPTAKHTVERLEKLQILKLWVDSPRNRLYLAPRIMELIEK